MSCIEPRPPCPLPSLPTPFLSGRETCLAPRRLPFACTQFSPLPRWPSTLPVNFQEVPPQPCLTSRPCPCPAPLPGSGESRCTLRSGSAALASGVICFPLLRACPGSVERRLPLRGWLFLCVRGAAGCALLSRPFSCGWLRLDPASPRGKAGHPSGEEAQQAKAAADLLGCSRPGETDH